MKREHTKNAVIRTILVVAIVMKALKLDDTLAEGSAVGVG
jgi:hypothetical protein